MAGDSTMVVRALLRDEVTPQLARIAAAVEAMNKTVSASDDEATRNSKRNSDKRNQELFKIDNAMRGVGRRMASRVLLIGAAIAAASGQAVALTDALWPMIGALGAIPAVAFGGLAGIAALVVGLKGLGAAMKSTGGGAGASADQIASAEHRIAQAQKASVKAQQDVNDAREQAVKDLRDMAIEYARANLNVQESALAVKDAELALRQARSSGNREERTKAELALQEALLSQQEAQNKLTDTTEQYNKMQQQGVENSDTVQTALQRQADATYELAQAQKALADAQKGGGGADAAAEAYAKLSDAGKSLVDTFKSLRPAWADVAKLTQQHLLAGVDDDIKALSTSYLPVMKAQLPAIADGWNTMFHAISNTAKDSGFVADMNDALGDTSVMFQRIGHAFGPLLDGFRQWVAIGSDFLPRLGSWVDRMAGKFDNWSKKMRETGKGAQWIENALTAGHQFNELLGSWASSLGKIFALGNKPGFLQALIDGSKAFQNWLDTAEGQDRITRMWARMRDVGSEAWGIIKSLLDIVSQADVSPFAVMLHYLGDVLKLVADNAKFLSTYMGPLVTAFVSLKIATMAVGIAQNAYNTAIGRWIALGPAATTATRTQTVATEAAATAAAENAAAQNAAAGATGKAGAAAATASTFMGKLGIIGQALGVYLGSVAIAGTTVANIFGKSLNPNIQALSNSLADYAESGKKGGEATRVLGQNFEELGKYGAANATGFGKFMFGFTKTIDQFTGVGDKFGWTSTRIQEAADSTDQALANLVQSGSAEDASIAFQHIADTFMAQGMSLDEVKALFPEYAAALQNAADGNNGLAGAADAATESLQKQNKALHEAVDPVLDYIDAQQNLTDKQKAYNDAVTKFGPNSAEAQAAMADLARAQLQVRDATVAMQAAGPDALKQLQLAQQQGYLTGDAYNYLYNQILGVRSAMGGLQSGYASPSAIAQHLGLPSYDTGGTVPGPEGKPQLAVVHGGETVVPADVAVGGMPAAPYSTSGGQGPVVVTLEVNSGGGSKLDDFIVELIRRVVRVRGGSVQAAFGTGRA